MIHWGTWRVNGQLAVSRAIGKYSARFIYFCEILRKLIVGTFYFILIFHCLYGLFSDNQSANQATGLCGRVSYISLSPLNKVGQTYLFKYSLFSSKDLPLESNKSTFLSISLCASPCKICGNTISISLSEASGESLKCPNI